MKKATNELARRMVVMYKEVADLDPQALADYHSEHILRAEVAQERMVQMAEEKGMAGLSFKLKALLLYTRGVHADLSALASENGIVVAATAGER